MANKKINQLVSKTAILSTDIFGIGDATTGQLFKKTIAELQAAIGGAVISVNGLVGTVVLDTDDIQELATPTNKYFTDARARGAISLTVTGNSGASTYSSGTGVLNVPTYTLAGLGGITATFLSGTSGISYNSTTGVISYSGTVYTDASIRALLSGSTGITYNSSTGAISYSGTVYTDASVRALISITTTGTSGASTYNNTTGVINVPNYTLSGLGGISLTSLSGGTGITYNNTTGAISYSGTVYTDASVRALISASGAVSYNNTTGVISLTSGNLTEATSSVLTITGGTGAVLGSGTTIQVKQASSTVSGFLSSTDWSTFNGKASALSGTTNYVSKFTSSTGIGNSAIYDDGTSIGIGATTNLNFGVATTVGISVGGSSAYSGIQLRNTTGNLELFVGGDGATDTFIRNNMNGNLRFGTNGTEKMRITSTGNVGFGTTSPDYKFTVSAASSNYVSIDNTSNNYRLLLGAESASTALYSRNLSTNAAIDMRFVVGTSESMRITSAGNVGIGSASITNGTSFGGGGQINKLKVESTNYTCLEINGSTSGGSIQFTYGTNLPNQVGALIAYNYGAGGALNFVLANVTNGPMSFNTNNTERGVITAGGNWLLGTSSDNGERLYVSGAIRATGTITANSDLTLKKNLLRIENALEKVEQINGYTYEFKEDDSKRHAGVIAQEIQTVLPEIVNKGNDGILGVEYGNISALLIEAIKEQQTQINELKALLNK